MAKVTVKSTKPFLSGGSAHMSGKNTAGPQKPAQTASEGSSSAKFASGGPSGTMKKFSGSNPMRPGVTSAPGGSGGAKFASGGTNKMFGPRGSQAKIPGQTGQ